MPTPIDTRFCVVARCASGTLPAGHTSIAVQFAVHWHDASHGETSYRPRKAAVAKAPRLSHSSPWQLGPRSEVFGCSILSNAASMSMMAHLPDALILLMFLSRTDQRRSDSASGSSQQVLFLLRGILQSPLHSGCGKHPLQVSSSLAPCRVPAGREASKSGTPPSSHVSGGTSMARDAQTTESLPSVKYSFDRHKCKATSSLDAVGFRRSKTEKSCHYFSAHSARPTPQPLAILLGLAAQATPDSANAFPLRLLKQPGSQMLPSFLTLLVSATAYHACPSAPTAAVATLLAGCDVLSSPAETS